MPLFRIIG